MLKFLKKILGIKSPSACYGNLKTTFKIRNSYYYPHLFECGFYTLNEAREKIGMDPINPKIERPTNCKNCGAPLTGDKCEYCGTEYSNIKTSRNPFEEIETAPPLTADKYNL